MKFTIQILSTLNDNKILSEFQSEFRKSYSCDTAFQCVLHEWEEISERHMTVGVIFLDLKEALGIVEKGFSKIYMNVELNK